jgi:hypothetical protein
MHNSNGVRELLFEWVFLNNFPITQFFGIICGLSRYGGIAFALLCREEKEGRAKMGNAVLLAIDPERALALTEGSKHDGFAR